MNDDISFNEWLAMGERLGYCSPQFCNTHDWAPMHESEEAAWEDGGDPCAHCVRLGEPNDWVIEGDGSHGEMGVPAPRTYPVDSHGVVHIRYSLDDGTTSCGDEIGKTWMTTSREVTCPECLKLGP